MTPTTNEIALAVLLSQYRAAHPASRAVRCWRYTRNGSGVKEAGCVLCGATLASWSARWPQTKRASEEISSHLRAHAEELLRLVGDDVVAQWAGQRLAQEAQS